MPKIFGFSRRRTKLGRLKAQLGDPLQGTRSPIRSSKHLSRSNEENVVVASSSGRSDGLNCHYSSRTFDTHNSCFGSTEEWRALPTYGNKPTPRSHHAAVVIGSKMVVVGGDSSHGLLDDTLVLNLETLTWMTTVSNVSSSSGGVALKFPACKGHSLVSCGKSALLVGGRTDPPSDKLSVWSFNVEVESWSLVEAKGNIPVARSGHTVHRAGNVLILFGGEDMKGRKLNDLYMFDLKSLSWLPLHYKGAGPSARSNHVAALYEDKLLFVYGGQSKSKILSDFYSLDFETYKTGTCITPMVQWPDKSFSLGFEQDLVWKRSGLILRSTIQFSLRPTFGGNNPGLLTELTHSIEERLNLSCGYSLARQPSTFASVALGRSRWNENAGNAGVVIRAEIPLSFVGRPSFFVQLNSGMEFCQQQQLPACVGENRRWKCAAAAWLRCQHHASVLH